MRRLLMAITVLASSASGGFTARGAEYHASPAGTAAGDGSTRSPWDLKTALASSVLKPGDTLWLHGGSYPAGGIVSNLRGTESQPIVVRGVAAERITLDCKPVPGATATLFQVNGEHVVFRDFEVTNSDPKRETSTAGSHPQEALPNNP